LQVFVFYCFGRGGELLGSAADRRAFSDIQGCLERCRRSGELRFARRRGLVDEPLNRGFLLVDKRSKFAVGDLMIFR